MTYPAPGRDTQIQRMVGSPPTPEVIAGVKTKSIATQSEAIDITNDDDNGYRTLLAQAGNNMIDVSVSGTAKDDKLLADVASGSPALQSLSLVFPDGAKIEGTFRLNNVTIAGENDGPTTFEAELQSSGAWTYTPGS